MIKRLWLILFLLSLSSMPRAAGDGTTLVKTDLKSEPFSDSATTAVLAANTQVTILDRKGGWLHVRHPENGEGWVRMVSLKLAGSELAMAAPKAQNSLELRKDSNRFGDFGVVTATGTRGIDKFALENAKPDVEALNRMKTFAASADAASAFAAEQALQPQKIEYLAAAAGGRK